jgi:hypothetical protein
MENLTNQLVFIETIAKLREELNDKIMAFVNEHNMFGEYSIERRFEVGDCNVAYCFDVEEEWADDENGKSVYIYLLDIDGNQTDGKYIWDMNLSPLEFFYEKVLLDNQFKLRN